MLDIINKFLSPLEKIIKSYKTYIGYFLLFLSLLSFSFLIFPNSTKESGEKSLLVLWIILWIPIFARVFGLGIAKALLPLRKELGILMGTLAIVHGCGYLFAGDPSFILTKSYWISSSFISYLGFGTLALIITIPLTLTSNNWAIKKLGKHWKTLHRTVYLLIILTIFHIALIRGIKYLDLAPIILLSLYLVGKILEWTGVNFDTSIKNKIYPRGQKWICPPCGFIYDPILGDKDSGILPGTEFSDIPNNWKCPECGVTKSDFIPLEENAITPTFSGIILEKKFFNESTLELIIETEESLVSSPGQFVTFEWEDSLGKFKRQYSLARHEGKRMTFLIKLSEKGRGATAIKKTNIREKICVYGVFGKFLLEHTNKQKIFIATGTGLAPIYNMIQSLDKSILKSLYFTVATKDELFYVNELQGIEGLDLHIHISREQIDGFHTGRVDPDKINATLDAEFYLCGNPKMVTETTEKLQARGFINIYSEEF